MKNLVSKRLETLKQRLGRHLPNRGGFTLVEILVVMMILTIGILPLALVQGQARREVAKADRYAVAMEVAQAQLEAAKGLGFGNATPDSGSFDTMTWRRNVQNISFGLDELQVQVSWPEEGGVRTIQVSNLISMR